MVRDDGDVAWRWNLGDGARGRTAPDRTMPPVQDRTGHTCACILGSGVDIRARGGGPTPRRLRCGRDHTARVHLAVLPDRRGLSQDGAVPANGDPVITATEDAFICIAQERSRRRGHPRVSFEKGVSPVRRLEVQNRRGVTCEWVISECVVGIR